MGSKVSLTFTTKRKKYTGWRNSSTGIGVTTHWGCAKDLWRVSVNTFKVTIKSLRHDYSWSIALNVSLLSSKYLQFEIAITNIENTWIT